ncbi:universal stress protein [Marivibrio halodurans]|uniref:Universal stress protein n=1 Tax=Marivibrio halodurans TaxID=2039722 RepID=A0A8J7V290_9PROT|nr:universal stress protein [Marivibrio halodurans]MBP5856617.1 universal stress protein [Marivibrio halodurans]
MFKKILCAVDGSEHSLRSVEVASEMAEKFGATLTILTVAKPMKLSPKLKEFFQSESLMGEATYVLEPMTEGVLDEAKKRAKSRETVRVETVVLEGQPARTICDYIKRTKVDCAVIGSRGLGDLEAALLGSVSHKVTSLADCTVVVVK